MNHVAEKTLCTIDHPVLIDRLLHDLPISHRRLARYRRELASAYVSGSGLLGIPHLSSPEWWSTLQKVLRSSGHYSIHEKTDYVLIRARISVLDVAIGAGYSTFAFLSAESESLQSHVPEATIGSDSEQSFNSSVDGLTTYLRTMLSNIRDAGAAHMRRTECKSAIDRLVVRLEYAVRTRPRPKKDVFGRNSTGMERLGGVMERYLAGKKRKLPSEEVEVLAGQTDGNRIIDEGGESG